MNVFLVEFIPVPVSYSTAILRRNLDKPVSLNPLYKYVKNYELFVSQSATQERN